MKGYEGLGHVNLIASLPSGHRPGNRACLPPKKKTGPKKQTAQARKKQMPLLHGACLPPARKKNKCPQQRKRDHKGQIPLVVRLHRARRQLFFPLAGFPSRLRPGNRACLPPEKKQAQKNKPPRHEKNKSVFVFSSLPRTGN